MFFVLERTELMKSSIVKENCFTVLRTTPNEAIDRDAGKRYALPCALHL
jgi:hypothetical protein